MTKRALIALSVSLVAILAVGVFYISDAQNEDTSTQESSILPTNEPPKDDSYLIIREWGVQIPLTNDISQVSYTISEFDEVELLLPVEGDTESMCLKQVAISRIGKEQLLENTIYSETGIDQAIRDTAPIIDNNYYYAQGAQAACSEDEDIQDQASNNRSNLLDAAGNIRAI